MLLIFLGAGVAEGLNASCRQQSKVQEVTQLAFADPMENDMAISTRPMRQAPIHHIDAPGWRDLKVPVNCLQPFAIQEVAYVNPPPGVSWDEDGPGQGRLLESWV